MAHRTTSTWRLEVSLIENNCLALLTLQYVLTSTFKNKPDDEL